MLADLARSGLTAADAKRMGLTPTPRGYKIPYHDIHGKDTGFYRERLLMAPEGLDALKLKPRKYSQPADTGVELYFSKAIKGWPAKLADPKVVRVFTEGEKKVEKANIEAIKAGFHEIVFIGLGGVAAWGDGQGNLLPEFDDACPEGSIAYICNDSDAATNVNIQKAQNALARRLVERGVQVFVCSMPAEGEAKIGLDDYLLGHPFEQLWREVIKPEGQQSYHGCAELLQFNEEVAYILDPGIVYIFAEHLKISPADFVNHAYSNRWFIMELTDEKGVKKNKKMKTAKEWIDWPQRLQLRGIEFSPGEPTITEEGKLNMWKGWPVEALEGDIQPYIDLVNHLFEHDAVADKLWFDQWCAYPIQRPGYKMPTAVAFWGAVHGSGKSLLGELLMACYGEHACELKDSDLRDDDNSWAENMQFAMGDDITEHDNRKLANKYKTLITQKRVRINVKYVKKFTTADHCNYYFSSNSPAAFFLEDGDRRFFIHHVKAGKLPKALEDRVIHWRDRENGIAHLLHHFKTRSLEGFNPTAAARMTKDKAHMTYAARSDLSAGIENFIGDHLIEHANGVEFGDLISAEEFVYKCVPPGDKPPAISTVGREFGRRPDILALEQVRMSNGKQIRLFAFRNIERWRKATPKQIREHYESTRKLNDPAIAAIKAGAKKLHDK
jgi:hypothetical protein